MGRADEKTDNVAEQLKNPSDMSRWEYAYKCISPHVTNPFGYDSQPDIFKIALPDKVLTRVYDKSTDTFVGMGIVNIPCVREIKWKLSPYSLPTA